VLKQRVMTALVLMGVFLSILFLLPWWAFAVFIACVFTIGAWEWSNVCGFKAPLRAVYLLVTLILGGLLAWWTGWAIDSPKMQGILGLACAWWGIAFLWLQTYPASVPLWNNLLLRSLMGWCVLIPAWLATLFLRNDSGPLLVLLCLLVVAAADVGAYFSGRAFGKRKLAPSISPGKSWEGVVGGVILAIAIAICFSFLFGAGDWLSLLGIVIPVALVSVVGDLFESMVKRVRGVKDSGTILPGHGGVLDRIDGIVAATPVFSFSMIMSQWQL
jgi:phosphatidate cytidylyltransferase